jgi:hypothetical protein
MLHEVRMNHAVSFSIVAIVATSGHGNTSVSFCAVDRKTCALACAGSPPDLVDGLNAAFKARAKKRRRSRARRLLE